MFKVGLIPYDGGQRWDDHNVGQVVGIVVFHDSNAINSLRFLYVKDNKYQVSEQHGNSRGKCEMITLDYPAEFFTALHGYYHHSCLISASIKSITFVTNKTTYGPFGKQCTGPNDVAFGFQFGGKGPRNWISGFYGTVYNGYVDTLGVYVQTPTTSQPESFRQGKADG